MTERVAIEEKSLIEWNAWKKEHIHFLRLITGGDSVIRPCSCITFKAVSTFFTSLFLVGFKIWIREQLQNSSNCSFKVYSYVPSLYHEGAENFNERIIQVDESLEVGFALDTDFRRDTVAKVFTERLRDAFDRETDEEPVSMIILETVPKHLSGARFLHLHHFVR